MPLREDEPRRGGFPSAGSLVARPPSHGLEIVAPSRSGSRLTSRGGASDGVSRSAPRLWLPVRSPGDE